MKIAHYSIETVAELTDNAVTTYVLENPNFFAECVNEVKNLEAGNESRFIISKNYEPINIYEKIAVIADFFTLDFNAKKIIGGITKFLIRKMQENNFSCQELYQKAYALISDFALELDCGVSINEEFDAAAFLKMFSPKIERKTDGLLNSIIDYINALVQFCDLKILILISVKNYLSEREYAELVKHLNYKEVSLINIEAHSPYKADCEKLIIIDKDLCEIVV